MALFLLALALIVLFFPNVSAPGGSGGGGQGGNGEGRGNDEGSGEGEGAGNGLHDGSGSGSGDADGGLSGASDGKESTRPGTPDEAKEGHPLPGQPASDATLETQAPSADPDIPAAHLEADGQEGSAEADDASEQPIGSLDEWTPSSIKITEKQQVPVKQVRKDGDPGKAPSSTSRGPSSSKYGDRESRGSGDAARRMGATQESEDAVDKGLAWLASVQNQDGRWNKDGTKSPFENVSPATVADDRKKRDAELRNGMPDLGGKVDLGESPVQWGGKKKESSTTVKSPAERGIGCAEGVRGGKVFTSSGNDVGATGLAVLAFLGAGHTHMNDKSPYKQNVAKALDWLVSRENAMGRFSQACFYEQGIATMAICEAYGMTKDKRLKLPAQKAIDCIVANIGADGGYAYEGPGDDTHQTSFQVMGLKSGLLAGLSVPKDLLDRIRVYYDKALNPDGTTGYSMQGNNKGTPASARTAVGLFVRMFMNVKTSDQDVLKIAGILDNVGPQVSNVFQVYDGTYAMFQMGGELWPRWNARFRDQVIALQSQNGSWQGGHGAVVQTALYIMSLEVYYRYLPVNR